MWSGQLDADKPLGGWLDSDACEHRRHCQYWFSIGLAKHDSLLVYWVLAYAPDIP